MKSRRRSGKRDLEEILAELREGDDSRQLAALRALPEKLPEQALGLVLQALQASHPTMRQVAAGIVGRNRIAQAIPDLVDAVIRGEDDCHAAAAALGLMGERAGDPICEAVKRLRSQPFAEFVALWNPEAHDRKTRALRILTRVLAGLSLPDTIATLETLALQPDDPFVRRLAVPPLTRINTLEATAALRKVLRLRLTSVTQTRSDLEELHEIQRKAAKALGERQDPDALPALADLLPIDGVGHEAIVAIAKITAPNDLALPATVSFFWGGNQRIVHANAIPVLCVCLDHGDADLRLRSAQALEHLARKAPTPALKQAVPALRRRTRASLEEGPTRAAYFAHVLECVEAAEDITKLPLPAEHPGPDGANLPRPSSG
jgi:hypothetical protein